MDDDDEFSEQARLKMQAPKKPKDAVKAAETLQKASDAQREKFMNIFQQMQASPAAMAQKTY